MSRRQSNKTFVERNPYISYKMLAFIAEFIRLHNYCPSYREIGMCAKITSTSHIKFYIDGMIEDGLLGKEDGTTRTTHLTEQGRKILSEWKEIDNATQEK